MILCLVDWLKVILLMCLEKLRIKVWVVLNWVSFEIVYEESDRKFNLFWFKWKGVFIGL